MSGDPFKATPAVEPEAQKAGPGRPRNVRRARNDGTDAADKAGKKGKDGKDSKRPIVCSCGRVFANGQALGGHRGKCKVPRERMRQNRDTADGAAAKPKVP